MKKLVLVLSLVLPATSLFAQQGVTGISDGFSFVAPLKVGVGTDNHFLVDRPSVLSLPPSVQSPGPDLRPMRLDDEFMTLSLPKIAFQNYSPRRELVMTYVPEIEMFRDNSDQNSWNHDAAFSFGYHFSRNVQASVGDSYITSRDPARVLENVFLLLPRTQYKQNSIRGEVDVQTSGVTGFQLRYDTARTIFGKTGPFQTFALDNQAQGVTFTVTHQLSRTQTLRAKASVYKFDPINRSGTAITSRGSDLVRGVEFQYRIRMNPNTYVIFTGGGTAIARGLTYVLGVAADQRLGRFRVGGGFSRQLAFASPGPTSIANGLNPNGFYDALFLTTRAELTRRSHLQLKVTGARSTANGLALGSQSFVGDARFDYRLSDRTVWFTSFQTFQQNRNAYVGSALSRNRFTAGIEFSLSSERDRRTNRLNEDERYVPLTDHNRRKDETSQ